MRSARASASASDARKSRRPRACGRSEPRRRCDDRRRRSHRLRVDSQRVLAARERARAPRWRHRPAPSWPRRAPTSRNVCASRWVASERATSRRDSACVSSTPVARPPSTARAAGRDRLMPARAPAAPQPTDRRLGDHDTDRLASLVQLDGPAPPAARWRRRRRHAGSVAAAALGALASVAGPRSRRVPLVEQRGSSRALGREGRAPRGRRGQRRTARRTVALFGHRRVATARVALDRPLRIRRPARASSDARRACVRPVRARPARRPAAAGRRSVFSASSRSAATCANVVTAAVTACCAAECAPRAHCAARARRLRLASSWPSSAGAPAAFGQGRDLLKADRARFAHDEIGPHGMRAVRGERGLLRRHAST